MAEMRTENNKDPNSLVSRYLEPLKVLTGLNFLTKPISSQVKLIINATEDLQIPEGEKGDRGVYELVKQGSKIKRAFFEHEEKQILFDVDLTANSNIKGLKLTIQLVRKEGSEPVLIELPREMHQRLEKLFDAEGIQGYEPELFGCARFASYLNGIDNDLPSEHMWEMQELGSERDLNVGDTIARIKKGLKKPSHFAVCLGHGLYLSKNGLSPLVVTDLKELEKFYGETFVRAIPRVFDKKVKECLALNFSLKENEEKPGEVISDLLKNAYSILEERQKMMLRENKAWKTLDSIIKSKFNNAISGLRSWVGENALEGNQKATVRKLIDALGFRSLTEVERIYKEEKSVLV